MNTKTDFKDFVDQYVIDEEFKMLECPFTDYGWQGFQKVLEKGIRRHRPPLHHPPVRRFRRSACAK